MCAAPRAATHTSLSAAALVSDVGMSSERLGELWGGQGRGTDGLAALWECRAPFYLGVGGAGSDGSFRETGGRMANLSV